MGDETSILYFRHSFYFEIYHWPKISAKCKALWFTLFFKVISLCIYKSLVAKIEIAVCVNDVCVYKTKIDIFKLELNGLMF